MTVRKPVKFTIHAQTAIRERELDMRWVERTIAEPEWRATDPADPEIARLNRAIPECDGRILQVACVESARILSAYLIAVRES
jgi:hypothetical protein